MIQKKVLIRTLSGVLVGGILLAFGGFALAGTDKNADSKSLRGNFAPFGKFMKHNRGMNKGGFKGLSQDNLNLLVKEGTLTQQKADQIKAYLDKEIKEREAQMEGLKNLTPEERRAQFELKGVQKFGRSDLFSELVADKVITQDQADAIKAKLQETMKQQQKQLITDKLKALVDKGTITQVQADKIKAKFEAVQKEKEALFEKTKDMTEEERHQFMADNKGKFQNPISQLVTNGTITQEQVNSLSGIMFQKGHRGGRR